MIECKGCPGLPNNCHFIKRAKKFKCPCFICLVKVMCENVCQEFKDFASRADERLHKIKIDRIERNESGKL